MCFSYEYDTLTTSEEKQARAQEASKREESGRGKPRARFFSRARLLLQASPVLSFSRSKLLPFQILIPKAPARMLLKSVVIRADFKTNSWDRTQIYEHTPPINALVTALNVQDMSDKKTYRQESILFNIA